MFCQDAPEGDEDDRKVFLSNMSYATSIKAVKEMFKSVSEGLSVCPRRVSACLFVFKAFSNHVSI